MSSSSAIEWTDASWNPTVGCTRVSVGCDHCYAVPMTHRLEGAARGAVTQGALRRKAQHYVGLTVLNGKGDRHFNGVVRCVDEELQRPLRWRKPARIFVNSMSDLFHPAVPFEFIDKVFAVMALTPQHAYQILTKRPERAAEYLARDYFPIVDAIQAMPFELRSRGEPRSIFPLPNVWLGTSVENQAAADARIPELLKCPAAVRFLSCEPLLGPLDLFCKYRDGAKCNVLKLADISDGAPSGMQAIHWVIVGGESSRRGRPCHVEWIEAIVEQAKAAGVPCFVKQLGAHVNSHNVNCQEWPDGSDFDAEGVGFAAARVRLKDTKGGDPAEWPEDLRVREYPQEGTTR